MVSFRNAASRPFGAAPAASHIGRSPAPDAVRRAGPLPHAQALSVLKERIGRDHLVVQRASIALVAGAVQVDTGRLDARETEIRGQFLDGFEVPGAVQFEQWKDEWRAKLMPRIRDSLVRQMDDGRRIGDFEAVERHAQLLLELDTLSEDAVRGVMEARAWVGDRSNALKVYTRFETRLADELGAKPSPDLVRIADLLREGRRAATRPDKGGQVSERRERRFEAETLIGREREFARLYDAWLAVRRREPRMVAILGDPGVGKTTLTNAFVSTCQMEGAVIARAQAYDAERELPFAVLAELVKQLTLQRAIGGADPEALSELTRVAPEVFTMFPGVPKPVEWAAEVIPLRLADCFLKAVQAATEESPLVLVVDDVHAADNATVAILHIVARKLPRTRLLVILTARAGRAAGRCAGREGRGPDRGRAGGAHPSGEQRQSSGARASNEGMAGARIDLAAQRSGGAQHAAGREHRHPAGHRRCVRAPDSAARPSHAGGPRPSRRARKEACGPFALRSCGAFRRGSRRSSIPLEGRGVPARGAWRAGVPERADPGAGVLCGSGTGAAAIAPEGGRGAGPAARWKKARTETRGGMAFSAWL